ncbi:MAG: GTP-binding protein [Pseudomonadota bacterium]
MARQLSKRLPVSVLTGFLGSGKTTLLNSLAQQASFSRTLVLINEFGEIGLDHDLVAHSQDDIVIEMSSGCLCCTIRGDLTKTLRDAPGRFARGGKLWFDRVVIETTGLADPAPILHTLMTDSSIARRYVLDTVITTVDIVNGNDTLDRQLESVKQAAMADRLLLTKVDLAVDQDLQQLQARLKTINPAAPQIIVDNGAIDSAMLFNAGAYDPTNKSVDVQTWLQAEAYTESHAHHDHSHDHHHHDVNRHDDHIKSHCITVDEPIPGAVLDAWLDSLLRFRGADFLRIKGIINVAELSTPMVIHGVQHIFHPPYKLDRWPSDDRRSRVVFITRDVDESIIRNALLLLGGSVKQD